MLSKVTKALFCEYISQIFRCYVFNLLPVCPWFVPAVPASLRLGVEALRSEIELYAPRQIVQREEEPYSEIRVVHSGLLSQAVINRRLSKPLAMNLYAEGSMMGFLNLFTGVQAPRLVTCKAQKRPSSIDSWFWLL